MVKRYGPVTAVDGLTLTAGAGQVTAVLGPNGAGKTTTIEVCEGYRGIDSGIVRVLGLDPMQAGAALRPRVGVMLQSGGIPPAVQLSVGLEQAAGGGVRCGPTESSRPTNSSGPR